MIKPSQLVLVCAAACTCLVCTPSGLAASPNVQVKDLGTLGGRFTVVTDLNEAGQVIGYSELANRQIHGFVYVNGVMHDLGTLGGPGTLASAINALGQITGFSLTSVGEAHAFLYFAGRMSDLGSSGTTSYGKAINPLGLVAGEVTPAGGHTEAALIAGPLTNRFGTLGSSSTSEAIGALGQVTGTYQDGMGSHAFRFAGSSLTDLMPGYPSFVVGTRAMNAAGTITGGYQINGTTHGFIYASGHATDLGSLGGNYTVATAINSAGKVTGISARVDGRRDAFLYSAGSLTDLGNLGGTFSVGYALSDVDQVAGESMTASGKLHAIVSQNGALIDLGQPVESMAAPTSVTESFGVGINRAGLVIGRYSIATPSDPQMPTTTRSFIASVPPPAIALFQQLEASVTGVGPGKSLQKKVGQAQSAYLGNNPGGSCSDLSGFVQEVKAQSGKKIPSGTAAALLQQAMTLEAEIGCP